LAAGTPALPENAAHAPRKEAAAAARAKHRTVTNFYSAFQKKISTFL
jgi:hypothetical protein